MQLVTYFSYIQDLHRKARFSLMLHIYVKPALVHCRLMCFHVISTDRWNLACRQTKEMMHMILSLPINILNIWGPFYAIFRISYLPRGYIIWQKFTWRKDITLELLTESKSADSRWIMGRSMCNSGENTGIWTIGLKPPRVTIITVP